MKLSEFKNGKYHLLKSLKFGEVYLAPCINYRIDKQHNELLVYYPNGKLAIRLTDKPKQDLLLSNIIEIADVLTHEQIVNIMNEEPINLQDAKIKVLYELLEKVETHEFDTEVQDIYLSLVNNVSNRIKRENKKL